MAASRVGKIVLKPVKSMAIRFCPFEPNVRSVREFLEIINTKKTRSTNINCEIAVDVRHDQSEPLVDVHFVDGERLMMKAANMTSNEMLSALNLKCNSKDLQAKDSGKK
ncbi:hypothetical protein GDO86_010904 [Hymenochirus boettgeri]|uniref:Large ribosomal subunit protein mL53 n=1 Tax=Hymenochirus boettgeri TaxID=247094 RepID=A0A8T2JE77_9PIPI|nr:hypothetical protein GDO86_010904 [Hymenochirus boettgeri]